MKKKTLEKQIRQVGFWTVIGIFSYMVMAFFLKSNYPIYEYDFNRSIAYDVIKDALTLGAAFLAPVAAFVLFSDWRSEHKIKSTLQLLDDLNDLSFHIKNGFGFYHAKIIMEKEITTNEFRNREDRQRLLWELIELRRMNGKFLIKNEKINVYQELIVTFDNLASKILDDLHILEYFSFRIARDKNSIESEYNQKNRLENFQKYDEKFKKLEALLKEITNQAVDVKESIL
ncbi:hypothetical protein [Acinetobacter baumannii]|uniref:hypothetical protein n=1 Tax=Acinetobacter baumannii TaxID=470 RepID=UPI000CE36857|nr:hypothetical protein [Acinetobacter baumannii]PPB91385.1 hypothetical protein AbaMCR9238_06520 [Acinetobacter baumannii]PPC07337.1 hypothetical protein AbaMCR10126_16995 [Acinetobacter baumannii]PPC15879.1 hypothetical protein AbaMCR10172_10375 [Acinetobacter baumannii]